MSIQRIFISCVLMAGCFLLSAQTTRADALFFVSLNTAPLINHPSGPFSINFQLNDGSGTDDANNTITLSNFQFGGGSPVGLPTLFGGAVGNLSGTVSLTDSSFFNEFTQEFMPGSALSFNLLLTTNVDLGATPDLFSFAIFDSNGFEIPTQGPGDVLLSVDFTSLLRVQTFRSDLTRTSIDIGPPNVQQPSAIPEPTTMLLFGSGLAGVGALVRLRRRT